MAIVESVLILVIAGLIGGTGYYVWHTKQQTDKSLNNSQDISANTQHTSTSKITTPDSTKTYTNTKYGFSFKYPTAWKLSTNLVDTGRGGPEGDIAVESPSGTKVHVDPNFGGKGGDCVDLEANGAHTTRTCTTRKIYSVEKLSDSGMIDLYLIKASDTAPTIIGGKTTYFTTVLSGQYNPDTQKEDAPPVVGSNIGAYIRPYDEVTIQRSGGNFVYLTIYVEGSDDKSNSSPSFLDSNEVNEAIQVLQSLHVT